MIVADAWKPIFNENVVPSKEVCISAFGERIENRLY